MQLIRATVQNFKLLEDVIVDFSTDPQRPLTVVRAENGSGKTSLLNALRWGLFGMRGLPNDAQTLRLTSSASPSGEPVEVSVRIEFENVDSNGETTRYRLIRSITETPTDNDKVNRATEARLRLYRTTAAGDVEETSPESLLNKLLPLHLRDVFFTDGDAVQTFISRESSQQAQDKVQRAIRSLLGLDAMRKAADDLAAVEKKMSTEAMKAGGRDTTQLQKVLDETDAELSDASTEQEKLLERLGNMVDERQKRERELGALRGNGDLDEINSRLEQVKVTSRSLETARENILGRMRGLVRSDTCSWAFLADPLTRAIGVLDELVDRNVIPGTSVEVLTDRLELGECICGEELAPGSEHRRRVEDLRDSQRAVSEQSEALTALFHQARTWQQQEQARQAQNDGFWPRRSRVLAEFSNNRDQLEVASREVTHLEERRAAIDESRVQGLTAAIAKIDRQYAESNQRLGLVQGRISQLEERRQEQLRQRDTAEKAAKINDDLLLRRDVARDLHDLASKTLGTLEQDYVVRVSERMNALFMQIVGSDPEAEAGVFTGVHIDERYNIIVDTHGGRRLDPDFELNGASQRALTLSFIWALMEVSGTAAPRTIDTPLGMVAGGVKTRMVDTITAPASTDGAEFQVVLLLTRSEIRDVEDLLQDRAGVIRTFSCSKDYPVDLTYDWGVDAPVVRVCLCNHRQSCKVCARVYDAQYAIDFRNLEARV